VNTIAERRRCRGRRGDAGPLEAVILLPALLAIFALVMAFGRTTSAAGDVSHAARAGARAAARAQTLGGATERAMAVVRDSLADAGLACTSQHTAVAGDMRPGGVLTVTVRCVVDLGDVSGLGPVPGSRTLHATASEMIDIVRGGTQ
jgi:Flp pilus assembly protein TadG